jgi:hypothetical protein
MISMRFHVYCDSCDHDGGETSALVSVLRGGAVQLQHPEELGGKDTFARETPFGWIVLCAACVREFDAKTEGAT